MSEKKKDFVDTTFRKKWDSEYFAQRAKDREAGLLNDDDDDESNQNEKKRLKSNIIDQSKPLAFFKARDEGDALNLSSKIGKASIVTGVTSLDKQGGFYCDVCDVHFKDSMSMMDHVNTKRHNRLKGVSMRVETSTLSQVRNKLKKAKDDKLQLKSTTATASNKPPTSKELQIKRDIEYEKVIKSVLEKEENEKKLKGEQDKKEEEEEEGEDKKEKENKKEYIKEKEDKKEVEYEEDEFDYSSFGLPTNFGSSKKSK